MTDQVFLGEVSDLIEQRLLKLDEEGMEPTDQILSMADVLVTSLHCLAALMVRLTGEQSDAAADACFEAMLRGALDQVAMSRQFNRN